MKLQIQDRVILQQLLPQKESFLKMLLIEDINNKIKFTPEEITASEIQEVNNGEFLKWKTDITIEPQFSKEQIDILLDVIKKIDESKEITFQTLNLAKKIYEYANPAHQINS